MVLIDRLPFTASPNIRIAEPDIRPLSPLIGLQAIQDNGLIVVVDGARSRVTIRRPWFPFFLS
ncbi:MAG: hypothetical protein HYS13_08020 [Planctomycetia bacterium]|nr:hypothetical protein [Planctomycetia bacterium]